jgi:ferredoxin-type protein NapH
LTKIKIVRIVTVSLGILIVAGGIVGELRYGGICSLGAWKIWTTCPLGFLERSLAARELLPQWPYVALVVLSVILLGRVFCAWVCPTVLLQRVFNGKKGLRPNREAEPKKKTWASYSPYAFLAGVLLASYLFRFPVFCLFCPIGLFFGSLFAVVRLFSPESLTLSLELVLFPVMLGVEIWVMKKSWCQSICPLGAMLSLIGNLNRFILPVINKDKCLSSKGANCGICERVCPEGIELSKSSRGFMPNSCTKCLECYDKCPTKAIKIAIFR